MTPLEKEMAIIKLQDRKRMMGMGDIGHLSYDEQVRARAQYRLDMQDIDLQILKVFASD